MHDCPLIERGRPPAAALDSLVASAGEMVHLSPRWRGVFCENRWNGGVRGPQTPSALNHRGMNPGHPSNGIRVDLAVSKDGSALSRMPASSGGDRRPGN